MEWFQWVQWKASTCGFFRHFRQKVAKKRLAREKWRVSREKTALPAVFSALQPLVVDVYLENP
jgi:hypothetical protein